MRRIAIAAVLLMLGGGCIVACRRPGSTSLVESADEAKAGSGWVAEFATALGIERNAATVFSGYIDADYVFVASSIGGTLTNLAVARGDKVAKGTLLFQLDDTAERAARNEAEARLVQAQAQLGDLLTGRRQPEVEAIIAQRTQAEASLRESSADYDRYVRLRAAGVASEQQLDAARSKKDGDRALVDEFGAQVRAARLAGREEQVRAARAAVEAARHDLAQADWRLSQMIGTAPADAMVVDTLFRPGEMVTAGQPVIQLLPPENLKIRFFAPEGMVADIAVGATVRVTCDGCRAPVVAAIRFISPRAEFTPPVIYSREQRSRLMFMVEARPQDRADTLQVGQPVDVTMELR